MGHLQFSTHVDAELERLFALQTSVERIAEWFPGACAVTNVTAPIDRVGARYTVWFGRWVRSQCVITPARSVERRYRLPGSSRRRTGGVLQARWILRPG
jgi:uncharacterized protein YndB with AHSA1/START domain